MEVLEMIKQFQLQAPSDQVVGVSWQTSHISHGFLADGDVVLTSKIDVLVYAINEENKKMAQWTPRHSRSASLTHPAFFIPKNRRYICVQDFSTILSWSSDDDELAHLLKTQMPSPIVHLSSLGSQSDAVVTLLKNGLVKVLSTGNLSTYPSNNESPFVKEHSEVIWANMFHSKLLHLEKTQESFWLAGTSIRMSDDGKSALVFSFMREMLVCPVLLEGQEGVAPVWCNLYPEGDIWCVVIAWQGDGGGAVAQSYNLVSTRGESAKKLILNHSWLLDPSSVLLSSVKQVKEGAKATKGTIVFAPINLKQKEQGPAGVHFVMVCSSAKKSTISIWDAKFGICLGTSIIKLSPTADDEPSNSELKGVLVGPSCSYLAVHFSKKVCVYPLFYVHEEEAGMLSAVLGKGKLTEKSTSLPVDFSSKTVYRTLKDVDSEVLQSAWFNTVTKPAAEREQTAIRSLEQALLDGDIQAATEALSRAGVIAGGKGGKDATRNATEGGGFSNKALSCLLNFCQSSNQKEAAIPLLKRAIESGIVSLRKHKQLVQWLLEMKNGSLLLDLVKHAPDLPELELVKIIRHLLVELPIEEVPTFCDGLSSNKNWKRKFPQAQSDSGKKRRKQETDAPVPLLAFALQDILSEALIKPHNPSFLRSSLANQLGNDRLEVQCLLTALLKFLKAKEKGVAFETSTAVMEGALDWIVAVIDSQFTEMVLHAKSDVKISALLHQIKTLVENHVQQSECILQLKGALDVVIRPNSNRLPSVELSEYTVEVLRF